MQGIPENFRDLFFCEYFIPVYVLRISLPGRASWCMCAAGWEKQRQPLTLFENRYIHGRNSNGQPCAAFGTRDR